MFSFQICVVALCSLLRCCQTMLTEITVENLYKTESKFMDLVFSDTTCYTDWEMRCVSIPKTVVDYKKFDVVPPFPVTGDLGYNILFTGNSLATVYEHVDSFMAFKRNSYSGSAVDQTLREVMERCVFCKSYAEAFVRFMNVVESEGISMLNRLCRASNKLLRQMSWDAVKVLFDRIDPVVQLIYNMFKMNLISTEPVRQIGVAIAVVKTDMKGRKQFFASTCMEFGERYGNMMDLVRTGEYKNVERIMSSYMVDIELQYILDVAHFYFKKETDAGPSGGGDESNVLPQQLQSEDNIVYDNVV